MIILKKKTFLTADIEHVISLGIIPYITPVSVIPNIEPKIPVMNYNILLEIYNKAARMLKEQEINPLKNKAGCVICGGYSAIAEAYKII